jgi:hypothetical protein
MKYTILFLFAIATLSFNSCTVMKEGKPAIRQGVFGRVLFIQGNQMPSPDQKTSSGKPVVRKIHIYELTTLKETTGQSPLFDEIKSKLVATTTSNSEGYFQCKLPIGKYSIFTVEEEAGESKKVFFANLFEGNGEITPFEIFDGKVVNYNININHKAYY